MSIVPSGVLSEPMAQAQTLLAATPAFRAWVGASNSAEAEGSIRLVGVDGDDLRAARPYCMVAQSGEHALSGSHSGIEYANSGSLLLLFEAQTPDEYLDGYRDAELWFTNAIGAILTDLWELSRSPMGYLWVNRLELMSGPARSGLDESRAGDDYQQVAYRLFYGMEG